MKASLKFREDKKPLVRAKIPLNILGLPFLSGISAGESKELCLNLSTFSEIGPSVKLSYRPNDSWNPFTLVVKTGIGLWGSPISSPMSMSAEFDLLNRGNPKFFLKFSPQIGDISVVKTAGSSTALPYDSSTFVKKSKGLADSKEEESETPGENGGFDLNLQGRNGSIGSRKANGFQPEFQQSGGVIDSLISDVEVSARSVLPIRNRAVVNIRWGVRFPSNLQKVFEDGKSFPANGISLKQLPCLVMSKIGIEHVGEKNQKGNLLASETESTDVSVLCYSVKHQLEALRTENGLLRNAVEELRSDIGADKSSTAAGVEKFGRFEKCRESEKCGARRPAAKEDRKSPEFGTGKAWEDLSEEGKSSMGNPGV